MPMLFEDWQRILSPKWLRDGAGDFWARAFGSQKDRIEQWIRDFMLSRFPDFAAVDALEALSYERGIEPPFGRDIYEVLPAWRAKLKGAMERWDHGGTHLGMLRELRSSLVGPIIGDGRGNIAHPAAQLYAFDATDALVNTYYDDQDAAPNFIQFPQTGGKPWTLLFSGVFTSGGMHRWNTFAVLIVIDVSHPWHGGVPGDDSNEAAQARRIVNRWKAAHAECVAIVVQDAGAGNPAWDVLWGVEDGTGQGFGPTWGSFLWGQRGGAGASTTYWSPPNPQ